MADEQKKLNEETKKTVDLWKSLKSNIKEADRAIASAANKTSNLADSIEDGDTALTALAKATKGLKSDMEELASEAKDLGVHSDKSRDAIDQYEKRAKQLRKTVTALKKDGNGLPDPKKVKTIVKDIEDLRKESSNIKLQLDPKGQSTKLLGEAAGGITDMFKSLGAGRASMVSVAKEGKNLSAKLMGAGKTLGGMPGKAAMLGGALKKVGAIAGGISKAFLGPIGAILAAAKAVWDLSAGVDQFVKDANKAFAAVRGPDIMTDDVEKQFREFNDQLFSIRDNLQVGLNVTQVREFMNAVNDAGAQIQNLNTGLYNYRDAIYVASKASRTLALEMPQIGAAMGTLLTDFQMNLEEIDDAFVEVAFSARKSGMSTDRFWNSIQNATASMSFYGVFVQAATKSLRAFSEAQIAGAQETTQANEQMMKVFQENTVEANAAIAEFAKDTGFNLGGAFEKASQEFADKATALEAEINIERSKGNQEAIDRLREEQAALMSKSIRAQEMIKASSVMQSAEMGLLADQTPEILSHVVERLAGNTRMSEINYSKMLTVLKNVEKHGIPKKVARMLIEHARQQAASLDMLVGLDQEGKATDKGLIGEMKEISSTIQEEATKQGLSPAELATAVSNGMDKVVGKTGDEQIRALNDMSALFQASLGVDKNQADTMARGAAASKEFRNAIENYMKVAAKGSDATTEEIAAAKKGLMNMATKGNAASDMAKKKFKEDKKTEDEKKKKAKDTFNKIVDQTLSTKEALKIAQDGAQWQGAMLVRVDKIAGWVAAMARKAKTKDPFEEAAVKKLGALGIKIDDNNDIMQKQYEYMKKEKAVQKKVDKAQAEVDAAQKKVKEEAKKGKVSQETKDDLETKREALKKAKDQLSAIKNVKTLLDQASKDTKEQTDILYKQLWSTEGGQRMLLAEAMGQTKRDKQGRMKTADLQKTLESKLGVSFGEGGAGTSLVGDIVTTAFKGKIRGGPTGYVEGLGDKDMEAYLARMAAEQRKKDLQEEERKSYERGEKEKVEVEKDVSKVTKPGMVFVKKDDVVVDRPSLASVLGGGPGDAVKRMDMSLTPTPMMAEAPGGGPGGPMTQEININVSADTKDLAQRIADVVRPVVRDMNYKTQLTGMG